MYYRCPQCGFVCIPEGVLRTEDGLSIYEDGDAIFKDDGRNEYYLDDTNTASLSRKLDWIKEYIPQGRTLLDAGSNYGHFLQLAQKTYDAQGFDVSPSAVAWSQEYFKVRNHIASIYDLVLTFQQTFDVITCWDTLEHLESPLLAINNLASLLKPDGFLFISTPNADSLVAHLMGKRWYYLNSEEHISVFSLKNMTLSLEKFGLEVISSRPIGHYYRLRYIMKKFESTSDEGFWKTFGATGKKLPDALLDARFYLKLFDVMGIACKKKGA